VTLEPAGLLQLTLIAIHRIIEHGACGVQILERTRLTLRDSVAPCFASTTSGSLPSSRNAAVGPPSHVPYRRFPAHL